MLGKRMASKSPLSTVIARAFPGGQRTVFAMLKMTGEAPELLEAWERAKNRPEEGSSLEYLLEKANMTAGDFIGLAAKVAYELNVKLGNAIGAFHYPEMMKASVKRAKDLQHGTKDFAIHAQHTGYLPTSRGISIAMQQNNVGREEQDEPGRAPSFAKSARMVVRELPPEE